MLQHATISTKVGYLGYILALDDKSVLVWMQRPEIKSDTVFAFVVITFHHPSGSFRDMGHLPVAWTGVCCDGLYTGIVSKHDGLSKHGWPKVLPLPGIRNDNRQVGPPVVNSRETDDSNDLLLASAPALCDKRDAVIRSLLAYLLKPFRGYPGLQRKYRKIPVRNCLHR